MAVVPPGCRENVFYECEPTKLYFIYRAVAEAFSLDFFFFWAGLGPRFVGDYLNSPVYSIHSPVRGSSFVTDSRTLSFPCATKSKT